MDDDRSRVKFPRPYAALLDNHTISFPLWRVVDKDGWWAVEKPRNGMFDAGSVDRLAITFTSYSAARIWANTLNNEFKTAIDAMMHKVRQDYIEAHAHECDQPIIVADLEGTKP